MSGAAAATTAAVIFPICGGNFRDMVLNPRNSLLLNRNSLPDCLSLSPAINHQLSAISHQVPLLPADLTAFVLFFEPGLQGFEIFAHRARGKIFPSRFL